MITIGSPYRACKGAFDSTAVSRPDLPVFFEIPPAGPGTSFRVKHYQPGYNATFVPVTKTPRRAPYGTLDWLVRNATLPMRGQEPLDANNVLGVSLLAPRGWTSAVYPPRVPRSLIILGEQTFFPTDTNWVDAITATIPPLSAIGVDVYLCVTGIGGSRFLLGTPASAVGSVPSGATDLSYTNVTAIDPADLTGGDVMFASMGLYSTGYAASVSSEMPDPCYVTYLSGGSPPTWARTAVNLGTLGSVTTYLQTGTSAYEAAMLLPVSARCRRFSLDVYGNDAGVPFVGSINPTLEECDLAFRNGIPGSAYHYSLITFSPAELAIVANQIVTNALAFFS